MTVSAEADKLAFVARKRRPAMTMSTQGRAQSTRPMMLNPAPELREALLDEADGGSAPQLVLVRVFFVPRGSASARGRIETLRPHTPSSSLSV